MLKTVAKYKYLGVFLTEYLDYSHLSEVLTGAAGRALGSIISKTRCIRNCGYDTFTKLFQSGVLPVMEYAAGVWGYKPYKTEDVGNRAMRYFLGVNKFAPLHAVHGDMGWKPVDIGLKLCMLRLWNRVLSMDAERIPKKVFLWEYDIGINNWCSEVEQVMDDINCSELYVDKLKCDIDYCETKLMHEYVHNWNVTRKEKPKLRTYNLFKKDFGVEKYVKTCDKYLRSHIAQIRSGILPLNIELGRHRQILLENRKCTVCNSSEIEDEFHFMCQCNFYSEERAELYRQIEIEGFYVLSNKTKFVHIMEQCNKNVGKFIMNSFDKRKKSLYRSNQNVLPQDN